MRTRHDNARESWGREHGGSGTAPEASNLRLRRFAHALGVRARWLTKSRAWSVTFAALRTERAAYRAAGRRDRLWRQWCGA